MAGGGVGPGVVVDWVVVMLRLMRSDGQRRDREQKETAVVGVGAGVAAVLVVVAKIGRLESGRLRAWREVPVGKPMLLR